jgi:hypothetical protein
MTEIIERHDPDQELIDRVIHLMEKPPEHSVILDITPGLARWVKANALTHNRAEKPNAIKRYAEAMASDGWRLNGSTVVFTDGQRLGDGQNRILACIRSDRPFRTHVIFGVPDGYFYSMDQGRVRSPADLLHIAGVANSTVMASATRWAEMLDTGRVKQRTTFTPPQILDLWKDRHSDLRDFLPEARAVRRLTSQPIALVTALLYTFDRIDSELAADFAEAWAAGSPLPRFRAIRTMEDEVARLRRAATGRVHEVIRAAMIVNAWNSVKSGQKGRIDKIRWDIGEDFPVIYGHQGLSREK